MQFPDIPTGSDWTLDKIVDPTAPFFTWTSSQYQQAIISNDRCGMHMGWRPVPPGQRIIVMQNPVSIASAYMTQIQTLPVTNPSFAIHGLGPVAYKGAPPKDCAPPKSILPSVSSNTSPLTQLASNAKTESNTWDTVFKVVLGLVGSIAVLIGIYFGVKFAMGPGGKVLAKFGESMGQKMAQAGAAAQAAAKNARAGIANTAGIGKTGAFPAKRSPIDDESPLPTSEDAKAAMAAAPELNPDFKEPTGVFAMNNPMFQNKVPAEKKNLRRSTARRRLDDSPLPAENDGVIPALSASNPLPEPNESITVPKLLPPHLRPRKGRNGTIRGPLRELPSFEDSPIPTPAEVDRAITPTTARDFAALDRPLVAPPTLSPEERKEMDLLDSAPTPPPPPPPGTHGLWRNGVSLSKIPTPKETVNMPNVARLSARLKRASKKAKDSLGDFDAAVENTPLGRRSKAETDISPLPTEAELDKALKPKRRIIAPEEPDEETPLPGPKDINPETGFTNSLGAKLRTADMFTNSLTKIRSKRASERQDGELLSDYLNRTRPADESLAVAKGVSKWQQGQRAAKGSNFGGRRRRKTGRKV